MAPFARGGVTAAATGRYAVPRPCVRLHEAGGAAVIPSSRSLPLRGLLMVAAAALIPVIAGCEAGTNAPTQQWHQPTAGASAIVSRCAPAGWILLGGYRVGVGDGIGATGLRVALGVSTKRGAGENVE